MSDIVSGFGRMVWRVVGYDSDKEILRQEIPLDQADARVISEMLRCLAARVGCGERCPSCGKALVVRINSKGKFSKPHCPECGPTERTQSRLRGKQR